jgi:hypothetical protein
MQPVWSRIQQPLGLSLIFLSPARLLMRALSRVGAAAHSSRLGNEQAKRMAKRSRCGREMMDEERRLCEWSHLPTAPSTSYFRKQPSCHPSPGGSHLLVRPTPYTVFFARCSSLVPRPYSPAHTLGEEPGILTTLGYDDCDAISPAAT